jgi:hypothetical protein
MRTSVHDLARLGLRPLPPRPRLAERDVAYATATELDFVSLPEALELVRLVVDNPRRFRRAALRWHARYYSEVPTSVRRGAGRARLLGGARRASAKAAVEALAALVHRRGSKQAAEALLRWPADGGQLRWRRAPGGRK